MKSTVVFFFLFIINITIMQAQYLSKHKWKHRLIVLADTTTNFKNAKTGLVELIKNKEALEERDIIIYFYQDQTIYDMNGTKLGNEQIGSVPKDFRGYILIGKDGGVKLKEAYPISPSTIFTLIDGMPMRRAEIRNKK